MSGQEDGIPERTRVWIETLKLTHFRNYGQISLNLDARHVVLSGDNGAGKTNLLEAISLLSPGRGLRRAPYDTIAQSLGNDPSLDPQFGTWTVFASLHGALGPARIGTGIAAVPGASGDVDRNRKTHIDGVNARSTETLLDHARIVWLTPAMDGLFTGPGSDRRRFLDRMVLAIDPSHGRRVSEFERAMRSRNKLLEDRNASSSWLDGIESQIAETGVAVAFARRELVTLLQGIIARTMTGGDGPFPNADIAIEGTLESMIAEGAAADLEDAYRALLCTNRARDRAAGRMLDGPHRSNLLVRHGPKNMAAALCSTGEQKALLLGLVLAHAQLVCDVSGMTPIILLDEVAAHLDEQRRAGLFDLIDAIGCQAWMTGTDAPMFGALGDRAQFFNVSNGQVSPAGPAPGG